MSLIKCPECGKEVSDKASTCIHCGYPLNGADLNLSQSEINKFYSCKIDGKVYDLTKFAELVEDGTPYQAVMYLIKEFYFDKNKVVQPYITVYYDKYHCIPQEIDSNNLGIPINEVKKQSTEVVVRWMKTEKENEKRKKATSPLTCPKCGSTAVTTGARGYSIVTGFLGAGKTVNRCGSCGYKWTPRN